MSISMGKSQLMMIQSDMARIASLKLQEAKPSDAGVDPKMRQAAEGFEALFMNQMLQAGRKGSLGDDLMGGTGTERMQALFDTTVTEQAASSSGLGLADAIVRQFAPMVSKAAD